MSHPIWLSYRLVLPIDPTVPIPVGGTVPIPPAVRSSSRGCVSCTARTALLARTTWPTLSGQGRRGRYCVSCTTGDGLVVRGMEELGLHVVSTGPGHRLHLLVPDTTYFRVRNAVAVAHGHRADLSVGDAPRDRETKGDGSLLSHHRVIPAHPHRVIPAQAGTPGGRSRDLTPVTSRGPGLRRDDGGWATCSTAWYVAPNRPHRTHPRRRNCTNTTRRTVIQPGLCQLYGQNCPPGTCNLANPVKTGMWP